MSLNSLITISDDTSRLLAETCSADRNTALTSKRTLWKAVRRAGRPGADDEKLQMVTELIAALNDDLPPAAGREVLWMLSEIGGPESVDSIAILLSHRVLREDARMALERIPGNESLAALQSALDTVSDDFTTNVAQSLRRRGVKVAGHPCQKLVPSKQTRVKGVG